MKFLKKKIIQEKWSIDSSLKEKKNMTKFFERHYKDFTSFGGDMEILLFSTKIAHSLRIFGKSPKLRKLLNLEDLIVAA